MEKGNLEGLKEKSNFRESSSGIIIELPWTEAVNKGNFEGQKEKSNFRESSLYTLACKGYKYEHIPYILESNPHPLYSFRGLKIRCGLESSAD